MFLVIHKRALPTANPEKDGVTFHWSLSETNIKIPMTEILPIHIYLSHPIITPVRSLHLDYLLLDGCIHDYYFDEAEFSLQLICSACRSYDPEYEGIVQNVTIQIISIQLKSKDFIRIWSNREQHRMVVTLKKDVRSERMTLGRAQMIQTSPTLTRTYKWQSTLKNSPDGMRPNEGPTPSYISPRPDFNTVKEVDHDGFSNPNSVLPMTIPSEGIVTLQFFNLKDQPPRFLEWSIRWASLLPQTSPLMKRFMKLKRKSESTTSPRGSELSVFKEKITDEIEACILYRFNDESEIVVHEIHLIVSRYREALEAMNDHIIPKTI